MERQARAGVAMGTLVAVVFGLVFIEVNSGGLPGSWPLVVRVAGAVVAAVLLAGVIWVARKGEVKGEVPEGGFVGRRYWNIVGVEGLALFGGLMVINGALKQPEFAVPWIALAATDASLATVNLVAGVFSGVALYAAGAIGVLRARPVSVPG